MTFAFPGEEDGVLSSDVGEEFALEATEIKRSHTEAQRPAEIDIELPTESVSAFLDLPTELRLNIYSHLWSGFDRTAHVTISPHGSSTWIAWAQPPWLRNGYSGSSQFTTALALMQTCVQLCEEVREVIYGKTQFKIALSNYYEFDGETDPNKHFLRFARNVEMRVIFDTETLQCKTTDCMHGMTSLFLQELRDTMEILSENQQLQTFRIHFEDLLSFQEDPCRLDMFNSVPNELRNGWCDEVDDGWFLLSQVEEALADEVVSELNRRRCNGADRYSCSLACTDAQHRVSDIFTTSSNVPSDELSKGGVVGEVRYRHE